MLRRFGWVRRRIRRLWMKVMRVEGFEYADG